MKKSKSQELYNRAKNFIPGGVNSPVRAFKGVGGSLAWIQELRRGGNADFGVLTAEVWAMEQWVTGVCMMVKPSDDRW